MIYREEPGSLFDVPKEYTLVHCISRDCAMGVGIAKEFATKYPEMREQLRQRIFNYMPQTSIGMCFVYCSGSKDTDRFIVNLVTKDKYFNKPTYDSLRNSLIDLRDNHAEHDSLAMPKIGCGLDGKSWNKVNAIIQEVFKETDVEILIRTN